MAKPKVVAKTKQEPEVVEEEESLIEYNNKTEESYLSKNLPSPDYLDYQEKNFLAEIDVSKEPIERTVTRIVRLKAPDYTSKKRERKEFIIWYENWRGKNWQGRSVAPVSDHVEGLYEEQEVEPVYERNRNIGNKRSGQHTVHYVPFSKEKVDEIIESSLGTDEETIVFVVKDGPNRNDQYSYQQFTNLSFADCVKLMNKKGGPRLATMEEESDNEKKKTTEKESSITKSFTIVDKKQEEPDIKLDKNVVQVENRQDKENKEETKEEEVKLRKPQFADFKTK